MILLILACGTSAIIDGWRKNGVETIQTGYVSAFYMETASGTSILFDTGGEADAASMRTFLEGKNKSIEDIDHLFITHGHTDHISAIPLLANAVRYSMPEEKDHIEEEMTTDITVALRDGGVTEIDELRIETLWVPGHTEGNAVFLVNNVLIMGDTAMASDKGTVIPCPSFFNDDDAKAKEAVSLLADRIRDEDKTIEWMVFSHTGPLEGIDPLMAYTVP